MVADGEKVFELGSANTGRTRDEQGRAHAGRGGTGEGRGTADGLALEQIGATAGDEDAETIMLVGLKGVLLPIELGCGHAGEKGQAHAGDGAPPRLAELGEEEGLGYHEEVMLRTTGRQENRGPVGIIIPGRGCRFRGHAFSLLVAGIPIGSLPVSLARGCFSQEKKRGAPSDRLLDPLSPPSAQRSLIGRAIT